VTNVLLDFSSKPLFLNHDNLRKTAWLCNVIAGYPLKELIINVP